MSDNPSSRNARKNVLAALVIAGVQVVGALLLTLANKQGMIEGETATRGAMVLIGLGIAAWGNLMPKRPDGPPPESLRVAASRQRVLRVGGWAMVLSGLAYAGIWAFAPRDAAGLGSVAVVGASVVAMFGYTALRVFQDRRSSAS